MRTTDRMRAALAWCEDRDITPAAVSYHAGDGVLRITMPWPADPDEFVMVARQFGAGRVTTSRNLSGVWADRADGDIRVVLHAGTWWDDIPEAEREALADQLRSEILAVTV